MSSRPRTLLRKRHILEAKPTILIKRSMQVSNSTPQHNDPAIIIHHRHTMVTHRLSPLLLLQENRHRLNSTTTPTRIRVVACPMQVSK